MAIIPKQKSNKSDIGAIKACLQVAKENGNICIFPEGNRSFNGVTMDMEASIARVAKKAKVKEKIKRTKSERIIFGIMFVFLCIYAGTFIFAYGTTILNSFKDPWDYALGDTFGLPKKWLFSNYAAVFTTLYVNGTNFWGMVINSLWQDITPTILTMASTMMASYAYSKYKFPGRKIIYFLR